MSLATLMTALRHAGICLQAQTGLAINVARELKVCCFPGLDRPVFLRILPEGKGDRDLAHLRALKELLGDYVNGPVKVIRAGGLVCGVFPFVEHERVSYESMYSQRMLARVKDVLSRMHAGGQHLRLEEHALSPDTVARGLRQRPDLTVNFRTYFEGTFLPFVARLTPVPQHCDFTYVNLAISSGDQLLVFDWEDYGLIRYPGFDLATFLIGHHYHGKSLGQLMSSPEALSRSLERDFGRDFLATLGLTMGQFVSIFPGYLALFLVLKDDGFGARINRRVHDLLTSISHASSWRTVLARQGD